MRNRKLSFMVIALLIFSATHAQTSTATYDPDWNYVAQSADYNTTYFVYNRMAETDYNGYKTQWIKSTNKVYEFAGRKYYNVVAMLQYKVDCDNKRMALVYVSHRDSKGNVIWSDNIEPEFRPIVPSSVGESFFQAICY